MIIQILQTSALGSGATALIGLLVAVVLGFILGYIYWRRNASGDSGELAALQAQYDEKTKEAQSANGKLMSANAKLEACQQAQAAKDTEIKMLSERTAELAAEVSGLQNKEDEPDMKLSDFKRKYEVAKNSLAPVQARSKSLEDKVKKLEDKIRELEPIEGKFKAYLRESDQLKLKLARTLNKEKDLRDELAKLKASGTPMGATPAAAVSVDTSGLEAEISSLKASLATEQKGKVELKTKMAALEAKLQSEKTAHAKLQAEAKAAGTAQADTGAQVKLEAEIKKLKADLDACQANLATAHASLADVKEDLEEAKEDISEAEAKAKAAEAKKEEVLARIAEKAKNIAFDRIGTATAAEKDDLKIIKGIGPFIEEKLNALSIYTFRQIANFTEEDEEVVNKAIEFFPGRIKRDQWSKQAEELADTQDKEKE